MKPHPASKPPIVDRYGVEFSYGVDRVVWLWPWRRQGGPAFISIYLSGTGEFGDARFATLRELGDAWIELNARLSAQEEPKGTDET